MSAQHVIDTINKRREDALASITKRPAYNLKRGWNFNQGKGQYQTKREVLEQLRQRANLHSVI